MSTSEPKSPEELREDIERTREELGDTVEALAAKTDVKAQAGAQADAIKESLQQSRDDLAEKGQRFASRAREAVPDSAQQGVQQAAGAVKQRPVPTAALAAFAAGIFVGWLMRRR